MHEYEDDKDGEKMQELVLVEIERYQQMDQRQPTYRMILLEMALDIRRDLMLRSIQDIDFRLFMANTEEATLDTMHVKAFDCPVHLGVASRHGLVHILHDGPRPLAVMYFALL